MSIAVYICELKNRLSHYLRVVRGGETVVVSDREQIVARIETAGPRAGTTGDEANLAELERNGTVRLGTGHLPVGWRQRRFHVAADVGGAVLSEREEGR